MVTRPFSVLNFGCLLSAEAASLSWDTSDVSSEVDRSESSRVCTPVADSFKPGAALVYLSATIHMVVHVKKPQTLIQFSESGQSKAQLIVLPSFSSRCWRIISRTLHGVAGMLVSPWWTKQHRSVCRVTRLELKRSI